MVNSIGYNYTQYNPYNVVTRQFSGINAAAVSTMLSGYQDNSSLVSQTTSTQTRLSSALKEVRESYSDLKPAAQALTASHQNGVFKKSDSSAIVSAVKDFADKYNNTVDTLQDNSDLVNKRLLKNLTQAASDNKSRLGDIGITINKDKTLTVDTDKLEEAISEAISSNLSGVKTTLGSTSGLASKVAKVSTNTLAQPMAAMVNSNNYVDQLTKNSQYQALINQYFSSIFPASFSQLYGVGGLVDTVI